MLALLQLIKLVWNLQLKSYQELSLAPIDTRRIPLCSRKDIRNCKRKKNIKKMSLLRMKKKKKKMSI
jgi:hypothetical protein